MIAINQNHWWQWLVPCHQNNVYIIVTTTTTISAKTTIFSRRALIKSKSNSTLCYIKKKEVHMYIYIILLHWIILPFEITISYSIPTSISIPNCRNTITMFPFRLLLLLRLLLAYYAWYNFIYLRCYESPISTFSFSNVQVNPVT